MLKKPMDSKQLKVALASMLEANSALLNHAEKEMPAGQAKDKMAALSGILAAVLLVAAANIATLELLENEYSDSE